jgi:aspartate racemase
MSSSFSRREVLAMMGATGTLVQFAHAEPRTAFKTIGVLGGMGPQATMDFEARVHGAAQRLIPPRQNSGYPPMIVYYHRHPPVLVNDDGSPRFPIQPDSRLLEAAARLGSWADFLVITSNGPHLVQDQIEDAASRPVLSMVDVTLDEIRRRGWRNVGVLGFGDPIIYTARLGTLKARSETIGGDLRLRLDREVMKVMEGRDDATSPGVLREAIDVLRARKVDGIILGCTELPLLARAYETDADLVDPAQLLAEAAVRLAMADSW